MEDYSKLNLSKIKKYQENVENFLNKRRVGSGKEIKYTHVAMGEKFVGKFDLNENDNNEFIKIYSEAVQYGVVFGIAEKPKEYGPLLIDIDLVKPFESFITDTRLYTKNMMKKVVKVYKTAAKEYLKLDSKDLEASIFEKPAPTIKEKQTVKDGFHVIFPNIIAHYKLRYLIRDKVVNILKDSELFDGYDVEKVIDKAVVHTNNWLLPGSRKKDGQLYELTIAYDENNERININHLLKDKHKMINIYKIQDEIYCKENKTDFIDGVTFDVIENEFSNLGSKPKQEVKVEKSENNDEKVEICLKCIDTYDDYSNWTQVGMILKNIDTSLLDHWLEWSSQSKKYKKDENIQKWDTFKIDGGLNMGSLIFMAKECNLELYNELMKELKPPKLEINIYDLNTTEIANHFKLKFSHKFISQNEELYCFNGVYWHKENKSLCTLNNFIGDEYFNYLYKIVSDEEAFKLKDKNINSTEMIEKFNKIRAYLSNLKNFDKRQKYINDILLKLNNDEIQFDNNPYLFAFTNKIYDLQKHQFIEPSAHQYISMTTGYKWIESDDKNKIDEINKLLNTIFPDDDIKKLYLTILSTGLDGIPLEKFIIANGSGGNGKGLLNEFVFSMLGKYSYILPSAILLNNLKSGVNVEVASMDKKRLIIAREPDSKYKINTSTIKEITGGEEINARSIYSSKTDTNLYLTFIMECNDKPKLDEVNDALARRILDVPFKNKFVDKKTYDELDEDDKKSTFLINSEYKSKQFKEEYRQALFLILCGYHKEFINNQRQLPVCNEIFKRNQDYLQNSDEFSSWFNEHYEKSDNKKDVIKLKFIYDQFKISNYFSNLSKQQKRELNYKAFVDKFEQNLFLRKYVKTNKDKIKIITNYKIITISDDDDDDEDKTTSLDI
jgi:P4 family phage/plasmid primase-like protien